MVEKFREWNSPGNWAVLILRTCVIVLLTFALNQYIALATEVRGIKLDVEVMKSNRFTSADGYGHDKRITIMETEFKNIADDLKEIKEIIKDVKTLIREK